MLWVILFLIWFKANHGGWWHFPWHFFVFAFLSPLFTRRFGEGWPVCHPMCTTILRHRPDMISLQHKYDAFGTAAWLSKKWIAGRPATAGVIKMGPILGWIKGHHRRCMVILKDFPCFSCIVIALFGLMSCNDPCTAYGLWLMDAYRPMKWHEETSTLGSKDRSSWWTRQESLNIQQQSNWWFQILFIFTSTWGNDPIWRAYFSEGLKPPTSNAMRSIIQTSWVVSVLLAVLVRASRLSFCRIAACTCECLLWGGVFFFLIVSPELSLAMSLPKPPPISS